MFGTLMVWRNAVLLYAVDDVNPVCMMKPILVQSTIAGESTVLKLSAAHIDPVLPQS